MRNRYLGWIVFVLALGALLFGIFNPEPPPRLFHNADKYEHLIAFAVVSVLGGLYIRHRLLCLFYWLMWFGLAYGLEYGQGMYLPKRTFDIYDVYANLGGVFLAFCIWLLILTIKKRS